MEHPSTWQPIGESDLTQEVIGEFNSNEHVDIEVFKDFLLEKYKSQGGNIEGDYKLDDEFRRWLAYQSMHGIPIAYRKWPRLEPLFFDTWSGKASVLAQRSCRLCNSAIASGFGPSFIAMRIVPITRQTKKKNLFKAYQAAVKHRLSTNTVRIANCDAICLTITYILRSNGRDKDLDNMTKALQDAVARAFGFDDKRVHHIDVLKIIFASDEEYILMKIGTSNVNKHTDVVIPRSAHSWAGQELLNPEDFMDVC